MFQPYNVLFSSKNSVVIKFLLKSMKNEHVFTFHKYEAANRILNLNLKLQLQTYLHFY